MIVKPDWLPDMMSVDGEWEQILSHLYDIFDRDFRRGNPCLNEIPVWWDRRIEQGDIYEEGFWHLISKIDERTGERLFDPRRAERLPWCSPILSHANDIAVKLWDYKEGKRIRTYVWLENFDYVIILEKRKHRIGRVAFLITAFYVERPSRRRDLEKKYMKREG